MIALKKLNELWDDTEKQFSEVVSTVPKQNQKFNKMTEIIKRTRQKINLDLPKKKEA